MLFRSRTPDLPQSRVCAIEDITRPDFRSIRKHHPRASAIGFHLLGAQPKARLHAGPFHPIAKQLAENGSVEYLFLHFVNSLDEPLIKERSVLRLRRLAECAD